jgi:hypothetical protein
MRSFRIHPESKDFKILHDDVGNRYILNKNVVVLANGDSRRDCTITLEGISEYEEHIIARVLDLMFNYASEEGLRKQLKEEFSKWQPNKTHVWKQLLNWRKWSQMKGSMARPKQRLSSVS